MSDVYAEFGVNGAVISSSDPAEHEQNMLALNVRARDGDAAIELTSEEEEEQEEQAQEEQLETPEEGEQPAEEGAASDEEFTPLGEPGEDLKKASESITEYAQGFQQLKDQAVANGLPAEMVAQIEADYEATGKLSERAYEALSKAGYTKSFVDSYIRGQEAVAEQFVQHVIGYAGGQAKFESIVKHMQGVSPESVESLYAAIERQDLGAIRSIINLGAASHTKKFGKAPTRSVTKAAPSVPPARKAPAAEGYGSKAEMIRDMSSDKYRNDPTFRAKVEARVGASQF